ncbi:MAG: hypothetical protein WEB93_00825, partial [Sphingomonadales bacterium]
MLRRVGVILVLAMGLGACAGMRTTDLSTFDAMDRAALVAGVPFEPQKDFYCGPASLAMALSWSGDPIGQDDVAGDL